MRKYLECTDKWKMTDLFLLFVAPFFFSRPSQPHREPWLSPDEATHLLRRGLACPDGEVARPSRRRGCIYPDVEAAPVSTVRLHTTAHASDEAVPAIMRLCAHDKKVAVVIFSDMWIHITVSGSIRFGNPHIHLRVALRWSCTGMWISS